ncbi:MAG: hypothetical protein U0574_09425 [Phycisphaerales bacterium]
MKHDGFITRLNALLKANAVEAPPGPPPDLMELLIHSFMLWEASTAQADAAMAKIRNAAVDFNEFRVCLVNEVIEVIGPRYPRAHERSVRVRAALNDLFRREHKVSLERAVNLPKRDAKAFIDGLQGMVPFVAARVAVMGLQTHAVPVDENTLGALVAAGVFHPETTLADATSWLQRHIHADRALESHLALQRAVDQWLAKGARKPAAKPAPKPAAEKGRKAARPAAARKAPR